MKNVIAFVNCHNAPSLGPLTQTRSLASTSFLGRYAFIAFPLSNLVNSEISKVGILVEEHPRSIIKHLGNGLYCNSNTKTGYVKYLFMEYGLHNPGYNSDINNL